MWQFTRQKRRKTNMPYFNIWFLYFYHISSVKKLVHFQCRWRAANVDQCSALMTIEQWDFFSVPHLLWHWASVYNGHLRRPVTLTPSAKHSAMELSLPVLTTSVCGDWDSHIQPSACEANALTHCVIAAVHVLRDDFTGRPLEWDHINPNPRVTAVMAC